MKPKKCKFCKNPFFPYSSTHAVCSYQCAIELSKLIVTKQRNQNKRLEREKLKEKNKTEESYRVDLQRKINEIARLIDVGCMCISSQKPMIIGTTIILGGHRFNVNDFRDIRYNLLNIHAQSLRENNYKCGNADGYNVGLKMFYGEDYFNEVMDLPNKYKKMKWLKSEIIEANSKALQIIKELKKQNAAQNDEPRNIFERMGLRKKYNQILGLYG
jgi:hypothetical protein